VRVTQIIQRVQSSAGSSYSLTRLAAWLAAKGHESDVLSAAGGAGLAALAEYRRRARAAGVLHGHGAWRPTDLFPLAVGRNPQARIVCSPAGTLAPWSMQYKSWRKTPFWLVVQRPAFARAHCFHATSDLEAADIRRLGFRQPIAVVPNSVEIPSALAGQRRYELLFLGRLAPEKNVEPLLLAWQRLEREFPQWTLRIAGPLGGAYPQLMKARAEQLGLARCEFTGELDAAGKAAAFSTARLFVLPSLTENFGIVVAEALAHGVPVVTTTRTPWSGLATHGCGWQVDPQLEPLKEGLRAALSLPRAHLEAMGAAGRAWVEAEFGWDSVGERMLATYEWLLAGQCTPAPPWVTHWVSEAPYPAAAASEPRSLQPRNT
jgi:glycosyltransferase involved in cell wall biosynthesis